MTTVTITVLHIPFVTDDLRVLKEYIKEKEIRKGNGTKMSVPAAVSCLTKEFIDTVAGPSLMTAVIVGGNA